MSCFPFQIIEKSISKLSEVTKIVANSDETTVDDFLVIIDTLETATANKDVLTLNARVKVIFSFVLFSVRVFICLVPVELSATVLYCTEVSELPTVLLTDR